MHKTPTTPIFIAYHLVIHVFTTVLNDYTCELTAYTALAYSY